MTELYLFNVGEGYYACTPSLKSKTFQGRTYEPTIVTRSSLNLTDNSQKSTITFKFTIANGRAKALLGSMPEQPIRIRIYRDETLYWEGTVISVRRTFLAVEVTCDTTDAAVVNGGINYRATPYCNHRLYSPACGVDPTFWVVKFNVEARTDILYIPGLTQTDGYFDNGGAIMAGQARRIIKQEGHLIYLSQAFNGILIGEISLYPGCRLTETACKGFNNIANGLMFARMPQKDPFDTTGLL